MITHKLPIILNWNRWLQTNKELYNVVNDEDLRKKYVAKDATQAGRDAIRLSRIAYAGVCLEEAKIREVNESILEFQGKFYEGTAFVTTNNIPHTVLLPLNEFLEIYEKHNDGNYDGTIKTIEANLVEVTTVHDEALNKEVSGEQIQEMLNPKPSGSKMKSIDRRKGKKR